MSGSLQAVTHVAHAAQLVQQLPRRRFLGVLALAALAGCATPQALLPTGEAGRRSLSRTGRFAITARESGREPEVVQGGFAWLDHGGTLTLDLTSPLGAALARLEVARDGQSVLTQANGQQTAAPSASELMAQVVKVQIPVEGLRDWLAGELSPGQSARVAERDALGRPVRFQQSGWDVRITEADVEGPLRLRLQRTQGELAIDVRLVLQAVSQP